MKIQRSLEEIHGKGGLAGTNMDIFKNESPVTTITFHDFIENVLTKYRNDGDSNDS